jgi:hypothetical protein
MPGGFNFISSAGGGTGGGSTLSPGPVNYYNPAYGGVPTVPNPTATAATANAGNAANLPQLEGTAGSLNPFNEQQILGQYNMAIPNYAALTQTASGNAMSELEGNVPQDVINQLLQGAAERGITGGVPESANSNAAYLRALGLTSIGQQQTGMANLHQLSADAPIAPLFNPASMFVTPEQEQEAQMASNIYASAPNPEAAAKNAIAVGTPPDKSGIPWWAKSAGMPVALGPGSYLQGNTWHTPASI